MDICSVFELYFQIIKVNPDLDLLNCKIQKCEVVSDTDDAFRSLTSHTGSQPSVQFDDYQLIQEVFHDACFWRL